MNPSFGDLLAATRRKRRLLQKQVADKAGLDTSYLGALERGRREAPSPKLLKQLLDALNPSQEERRCLLHALGVLRLQRFLSQESVGLEGAAVLLRIAEGLPQLHDEDLDLLEALVQRLSRASAARGRDAM